jgi:hypothetical protein
MRADIARRRAGGHLGAARDRGVCTLRPVPRAIRHIGRNDALGQHEEIPNRRYFFGAAAARKKSMIFSRTSSAFEAPIWRIASSASGSAIMRSA